MEHSYPSALSEIDAIMQQARPGAEHLLPLF